MDGEVLWHVEPKENTISRYAWLKTYGMARWEASKGNGTKNRCDEEQRDIRARKANQANSCTKKTKTENGEIRLFATIPTAEAADR